MILSARIGFADFFYAAHLYARLMSGILFLLLAVLTQTLLASTVLLLLAMLLLRLLNGSWLQLIAAVRLLRWFVIPIFTLHALFSHGQLLFPDLPIPLTREGVVTGMRLSLHLASIFMAALLMFSVLRRRQWVKLLMAVPGSAKSAVYLMMLLPMRQHLALELRVLRESWRLQGGWQQLHMLLLTAFVSALAMSRRQADALWLRWPGKLSMDDVVEWHSMPTIAVVSVSLMIVWGMLFHGFGF